MSLADQVQRVLYRLKAEGADKVQKDFEKIADAEQEVAREAINVEQAIATIGIKSEETKSKLTRMVESAGGGFTSLKGTLGQIGSGFQTSIKGLNDMAGKLGPWNQALELGGKAVKFIDESFDTLAKKDPSRRKEIEETRKAFQGLGDGVKQATAELALFVADGWKPVEDALKRAQKITAEVRKFYGLDKTDAAKGINFLLEGGITDAIKSGLDNPWIAGFGDALEAVGETKKKFDADQKKAAADARKDWETEMRDWAAERASIIQQIYEEENAAALDRMKSDEATNTLSRASRSVQSNVIFQSDDYDALIQQSGLKAEAEFSKMNEKAYDAYNVKSSKLETLFGPIEEFDAYQQSMEALGATFDTFTQAIGAGYAALVTGQGSVINALRATAAAGIMAQGQQSVIAALRETALGFGALALGSPTAASHFKSAALHGAVAVAAGLAARALAPSGGTAPSAPAASGGSAGGRSSMANDLVEGGRGGGQKAPITIIMGESFSDESPRMRSIKASEAVDRALRLRDE